MGLSSLTELRRLLKMKRFFLVEADTEFMRCPPTKSTPIGTMPAKYLFKDLDADTVACSSRPERVLWAIERHVYHPQKQP